MKTVLLFLVGVVIIALCFAGTGHAQCTQPTAICALHDTTVYTTLSCTVSLTIHAPTVIANGCPDATTHGCWSPSSGVHHSGTSFTFPVGSSIVECDAYSLDHPEIPADTCSFTVTVIDTSKPQLSSAPPFDLFSTVNPGECTAAVTYDVPEFEDDCHATTVCVPPPNSPFPVGVTTVHCTATDPSGNVGSVSFKVTVQNYYAPVITCPRDTTIECGTSTDPNDLGRATATASCNVGVKITYDDSPAEMRCGIAHRINRTWKATDSSGVEATCTQRITIQDNTPPQIRCPADIIVPSQVSQIVNFIATAIDGCDPHPHVSCTPPSGSTFSVGITTVTCTAEDCDGNSSQCTFDVAVAVPEPIDFKPGSCPNPVNTLDRGLIPVAVLGTSTFNASQINPSTVRLAGVAPTQWALGDVAMPFTPYVGKTSCSECNTKKDRITDMTFKFDAQTLINALRPVTNGECRVVQLVGQLNNGTPFVGEDVVRMIGSLGRLDGGGEPQASRIVQRLPESFVLEQSYPNPFNPETRISYGLPEAAHVRLVVYDILGREVTTLVDEVQTAGYKSVKFDAGHLASGVYFYRLQAGAFTQLRKMLLVK